MTWVSEHFVGKTMRIPHASFVFFWAITGTPEHPVIHCRNFSFQVYIADESGLQKILQSHDNSKFQKNSETSLVNFQIIIKVSNVEHFQYFHYVTWLVLKILYVGMKYSRMHWFPKKACLNITKLKWVLPLIFMILRKGYWGEMCSMSAFSMLWNIINKPH